MFKKNHSKKLICVVPLVALAACQPVSIDAVNQWGAAATTQFTPLDDLTQNPDQSTNPRIYVPTDLLDQSNYFLTAKLTPAIIDKNNGYHLDTTHSITMSVVSGDMGSTLNGATGTTGGYNFALSANPIYRADTDEQFMPEHDNGLHYTITASQVGGQIDPVQIYGDIIDPKPNSASWSVHRESWVLLNGARYDLVIDAQYLHVYDNEGIPKSPTLAFPDEAGGPPLYNNSANQ